MINQPNLARPVPWFALFAVDFAVTAVTLVAFGLCGDGALTVGRVSSLLTAAAEMGYPAVDFCKP